LTSNKKLGSVCLLGSFRRWQSLLLSAATAGQNLEANEAEETHYGDVESIDI
jgi:hypothetical protein